MILLKTYLSIAIGGCLGAICRYAFRYIPLLGVNTTIPLPTLFVNILGSFMLAGILTAALEVWDFGSEIRLGITTGFLGAFTTFSTLCKETVGLMRNGNSPSALFYLSVSTILGLAAAYGGIVIVRKIACERKKSHDCGLEGEE